MMRAVAVLGTGEVSAAHEAVFAPRAGQRSRLGRMDRYTRMAVFAADAAVRSARLDPETWRNERIGIVLGSALGCYESNLDHRAALDAGEPSPRLFAATLPSTPVGEIAIHLQARGPQLALAQGACAPLLALAFARRLLVWGRADVVVAGSCEALPETLRGEHRALPRDGAHFCVLAPEPGIRGACAVIHGGGAASGDDARKEAIKAACHEAGFDLPPAEWKAGLSGALGSGRPALVVATDELGSAAALIVS